mmetsp:Transcript_36868/g.115951  ORF Transcript_36868/g.115951 Transcript_36868/m.115951 type:complete len:211 (+) Transcript_36868:314-946(+)
MVVGARPHGRQPPPELCVRPRPRGILRGEASGVEGGARPEGQAAHLQLLLQPRRREEAPARRAGPQRQERHLWGPWRAGRGHRVVQGGSGGGAGRLLPCQSAPPPPPLFLSHPTALTPRPGELQARGLICSGLSRTSGRSRRRRRSYGSKGTRTRRKPLMACLCSPSRASPSPLAPLRGGFCPSSRSSSPRRSWSGRGLSPRTSRRRTSS